MARALVFVGLVCLAFSAAGAASVAAEADNEAVTGRQLLTEPQGYWAWFPDQVQQQSAYNWAGNNGPAYQQAVNQANQQQGNGNTAVNSNSQSFQFGPNPPAGKDGKPGPGKDGKGRKLLGYWGWFPDQVQQQSATNYAGNNGPAYQQAVNQGNQQQGNWNAAGNFNSQSFQFGPPDPPAGKDGKPGPGKDGKGRKLLGYWGWVPTGPQVQWQGASNSAGNNGPAYQQAVNQGNQQQGSWNEAVNSNSQSFQFPADPAAGKPGKPGKPGP